MVKSIFGFRLQSAAVAIGWLGILLSISVFVFNIIILVNFDDVIDPYINGTNTSFPFFDHDDENLSLQQIKQVIYTGLCVQLCFYIIRIVSSMLLIVGALKEKHLYLIPWLLNNGIIIIFDCLMQAGILMFLIRNGIWRSSIIMIVEIFLITGINIYIWLGIYSLYKIFQSYRDQRLFPSGTKYPSYTSI